MKTALILALAITLAGPGCGEECDGHDGDRCDGNVIYRCVGTRDGFAVDHAWEAGENCADSDRVCVQVTSDPQSTPNRFAFCAESATKQPICEAIDPSGPTCDGSTMLVSCMLGYVTGRMACQTCSNATCGS